MKYIYIILLAVLAYGCFGPKENKKTANAEPADSIKGYYGPCVEIDSIVHRYTVTRWSHAFRHNEEDKVKYDEWRPKNIEVLLSEDIFVDDEPAQMYHVVETYPWDRMPNGQMVCTLVVTDQDDETCEIMLQQDSHSHLLMYVDFGNEIFCYDMTEQQQTAE